MKEVKELKFEELTAEQKLGLVLNIHINPWLRTPEWERFFYDQLEKRAIGSVWIQSDITDSDKMIEIIREKADYPILIITDAESGIYDYRIGRLMQLVVPAVKSMHTYDVKLN